MGSTALRFDVGGGGRERESRELVARLELAGRFFRAGWCYPCSSLLWASRRSDAGVQYSRRVEANNGMIGRDCFMYKFIMVVQCCTEIVKRLRNSSTEGCI